MYRLKSLTEIDCRCRKRLPSRKQRELIKMMIVRTNYKENNYDRN